MSYRGKTLLLKDQSYASSIYRDEFIDDAPPPPPAGTNVFSLEENAGVKKVYVTDDNKAFAVV
jgi:hypothetical protein